MMMGKMIAGLMGMKSNQGAKGKSASVNVDPLERLGQKMAGRMEGGAVKKKTEEDRARMSMMRSAAVDGAAAGADAGPGKRAPKSGSKRPGRVDAGPIVKVGSKRPAGLASSAFATAFRSLLGGR